MFDGFPTPARVIAPHSATRYSDGYSWFEFRRSDPDFSAPGIGKAADELADFARAVAARRPTTGKPIVVGFSQGGALSFALGALHSDVVGAAFPIGGWFPAALWPARKPDVSAPIVAFHGAADTMVPLSRMRPGASRLAGLGFSVDVREFEGIGHTISEPERRALFDELTKACERARQALP
jgi:phospholipase/carboxylesterase